MQMASRLLWAVAITGALLGSVSATSSKPHVSKEKHSKSALLGVTLTMHDTYKEGCPTGADELATLRSFVATAFTTVLQSCGAKTKIRIGDVECVVKFNHGSGCSRTIIKYAVKIFSKKESEETLHKFVDEMCAAQHQGMSVCDAEGVDCDAVAVSQFAIKKLQKKLQGTRMYAFKPEGKHAALFTPKHKVDMNAGHGGGGGGGSSSGSGSGGYGGGDGDDSSNADGGDWDNEDSWDSEGDGTGGYGGGSNGNGHGSPWHVGGGDVDGTDGFGEDDDGWGGSAGGASNTRSTPTSRKFMLNIDGAYSSTAATAAVPDKAAAAGTVADESLAPAKATGSAATAPPAQAPAKTAAAAASPVQKTTIKSLNRHNNLNTFDARLWPEGGPPFRSPKLE